MTNCNIIRFVEVVEDDEKTAQFFKLLEDWYNFELSILVFIQRKIEANILFTSLVEDGFE
jgi:hypothetical protein